MIDYSPYEPSRREKWEPYRKCGGSFWPTKLPKECHFKKGDLLYVDTDFHSGLNIRKIYRVIKKPHPNNREEEWMITVVYGKKRLVRNVEYFKKIPREKEKEWIEELIKYRLEEIKEIDKHLKILKNLKE